MTWRNAFSGQGNCEMNLSYTGTGSPKTCPITYNILAPQTYVCPNGVCETGLGETQANCFADCGVCSPGYHKEGNVCVPDGCPPLQELCNGRCVVSCLPGWQMNEFCSCAEISKCGNGIIDPNETCEVCEADMEAVNGVGYCDERVQPNLFLILIVVGAIVVIGGGVYYLFVKKKKGRK